MLSLEFPRKLSFLLKEPARLKVLYGGRGGGKSINSVRAAIIFAKSRKLEIVCFRELQKSIQESLHGVITNEIEALGLTHEFEIMNAEIIHKMTGARFTFEALRYNISKIKSRARIDIALLEEADNISKTSLDILMPTVRSREYAPNDFGGPFGKGPEIWILFNPKLDSDEVYKRFVINRDTFAPDFDKSVSTEDAQFYLQIQKQIDDKKLKFAQLAAEDKRRFEELRLKRYAIVCKVNHSDNKWFPADLRREMEILKVNSPDDWLHVWEGNTKQVLDGAIYAEEIKKVLLEGRRTRVKYDPSKPVHTYWDLGFNDHTAIWFVQQMGVEYNLINYYQNRLVGIPHYIEHLQSLKYNYGMHNLPHDGDNNYVNAERSTLKQLRLVYPGKVRLTDRVSKKIVGIRAARSIFGLLNFDEENTADGWQCLCRYAYDVDEDGKFSQNPAHNEWSHGADAFQTMALSIKPEQVTKKTRTVASGKILNLSPNQNSWMSG